MILRGASDDSNITGTVSTGVMARGPLGATR